MGGVSQPSGTVTLLFSDIEGSTRLLHELGTEAYREALAEHRRIVREAYARYRGYEVDYEGDAFFYAFSSAPAALAAVSEAMAGLEGGPISIRVGIHSGEPGLDPPKYVGMDVHLAARVMSSAHGGQVVLSATTAELIKPSDTVSQGVVLTDLGEHRLKDIQEPVLLFQLGEGSFPPLKTISNTNLPRPASSFLGREAELAEVLSRIEGGARLVTLTGPGGTGKTRLALEAATTLVPEYKAGVFWVGLASLRDPALVTETIAQTLGAKDSLAEHIGERELCLLLDNFEQVIAAAPELSALLESCPNLTLLVTSRELLRISGEVEYPVPPLAEPEAVSLFCERAQLDRTDEIVELCARLDSLPLAVELAAARTKALTPAQILKRLAGRLDLLKGGRDADPRQQTLRATIEWSYELLTPDEQGLFASLSVFAGGCTLEAAEEVCDADLDTLQSLVEKSLLRFTPSDTGGRFWMLETIREYAAELLFASAEGDTIRSRHTGVFIALADEARPHLIGWDQAEWLGRLEPEQPNLRTTLDYLRATEDAERLAALLSTLWFYWRTRGELAQAARWFDYAVAESDRAPTTTRMRLLLGACAVASQSNEYEAAIAYGKDAFAIATLLDDPSGMSAAQNNIAAALAESGDLPGARAALAQSATYAREAGNQYATVRASMNLAYLDLEEGTAHDMALFERAVSGARSLGAADLLAGALLAQAHAFLLREQLQFATEPIAEAAEVAKSSGDLEVSLGVLELASALALRRGNDVVSARLMGAAEGVREDLAIDSYWPALTNATAVALRRSLDEQHHYALALDGRRLAMDEAVEYALASID
jgi:predicted ATPase/class 3 adenylate cyclase